MEPVRIHRFRDAPLEIEEAHALDVDGLLGQLQQLFSSKKWTPPVPPGVATQVLALSRESNVDPKKVAALFQQDPMLTARVMKVARSPLFGSAKLTSVLDAIVRLGMRQMQHVVLEAALEMRVFHSETYGPWMERIRRHSVATAHAARKVARECNLDGEVAFVAGLLHDVGAAAVLGAIGDRADMFPHVEKDALASAMDDLHLDVGVVVAEAWGMPKEVVQLAGRHHHVGVPVGEDPLLSVLVLAESIVVASGFAVVIDDAVDLDPVHEADVQWARRSLDIDGNRWDKLFASVGPLLAQA